jgi:hypothetical protein
MTCSNRHIDRTAMAPSTSSQLDLTRRYARELRRLQGEARSAFGKSGTRLRQTASDLSLGIIPSQGREEETPEEVRPGVGHA